MNCGEGTTDERTRKAEVVDFLSYRAARAEAQLSIFDAGVQPRWRPGAAGRRLSAREIAHREQMLTHLRAGQP